MYYDFRVKIPKATQGITRKRIKGTTYIYYTYKSEYSSEKKYTVPKGTSVGKADDNDPDMMYPNANFIKYFPATEIPTERNPSVRSGCLRVGAYLVLRKIISEYRLDALVKQIIGKDSGLFLDLAVYTIIAENNAGQYYPDYAYNHPLFTDNMRIYSDSKVSDFIGSITRDQSLEFQNEWNSARDHRETIYISYDSTNKNCQAGDIELVEFGHAKDDVGLPVINYSIAYDRNNSVPLYYEDYPGSIVDVSQLQFMLEKANGYGYKNVGFILDRGYFSKENIHYMDRCGYDFVIMMRGMKDLVRELVLSVKGTFEEDREKSIRDYKVSGTTVKHQLFPSDEKERYFHIYFNERKRSTQRENVESHIDRMAECLKKYEGTNKEVPKSFSRYFDLIYYHEGQEDQKFMFAKERNEVINADIKLCGYFVIITSKRMTAEEALNLYKGRDASEKLFSGDKSYLGNKSFRVQTTESVRAKIFIEFVALIIRNRFYTLLKEQMTENGKKQNYMTVPAALRELEKIEMIRQSDGEYRLDYAVTSTQKEILKAFGMTAANVREQAVGINEDLKLAEQKV